MIIGRLVLRHAMGKSGMWFGTSDAFALHKLGGPMHFLIHLRLATDGKSGLNSDSGIVCDRWWAVKC